MEEKQFIEKIQGAYGSYNSTQLITVVSWLKQYKGDLSVLFAEVLASVSWLYSKPPGPKEFEDCKMRINNDKREKYRPELKPYKPQLLLGGRDDIPAEKWADLREKCPPMK